MDTTVIFDFLQELSRCEYIASSGDVIEDFRYNGIMYREGRETYNIKLNSMLTSFKNYYADTQTVMADKCIFTDNGLTGDF
jgi:hypothetical protein